MRVLQERLRHVEGELEEDQEERNEKYAELRSREQNITGQALHVLECPYRVCTCISTSALSPSVEI